MILTQKEKRLISKMREHEARNRPCKTGILKHNLYFRKLQPPCGAYFLSTNEMNQEMREIKDTFELALKTGAKFSCYMDGIYERWSDDAGYGADEMDSKWAEEHLKNIKETK